MYQFNMSGAPLPYDLGTIDLKTSRLFTKDTDRYTPETVENDYVIPVVRWDTPNGQFIEIWRGSWRQVGLEPSVTVIAAVRELPPTLPEEELRARGKALEEDKRVVEEWRRTQQ